MLKRVKNDAIEIALKKLKAKEDSFKQFEAIANLGSWEIDLITKKSIWSHQSYKNYGIPIGSDVSLNTFLSLVIPEDIPYVKETLEILQQTRETQHLRCRVKRTDGKIIHVFIIAKMFFDADGIPLKLIGTTQDVTEEIKLKEHALELSDLVEHSSTEIYIVDVQSLTYLYANKGAINALGYSLEKILTMHVQDINPDLDQKEIDSLTKILQTQNHLMRRSRHRRKDGSFYEVQAYIHTLNYKGKKAIVLFDTDITQQANLEKQEKKTQRKLDEQTEKLRYQATHDSLTNLANRTLFQHRLSQTIITAKKEETKFALLFLDLDQFKKINDTLGHDSGDQVLIEVASRLQKNTRKEDTLSRLGGDEFTLLLQDINEVQNISIVAEKILNTLQKPIIILGHKLYITVSIGISIYPDDTSIAKDLIKYADSAMYRAKDEGRNNYQFYSKEMTTMAYARITMESNLRTAIKEKQFVVYFQPQVEALTDKIVGMEALVRWQHPTLGLLNPAKFIPIAEENGLIIPIDRLVMREAMQQYVTWYEQGFNPGLLSLNLAMGQLTQNDFLDELNKNIAQSGFHTEWLELEVTETQIMKNPNLSIKKLHTISQMGIELAIDDFGTGYSSLAYLKRLPVNKLKIDQSFIRDIPNNSDDIIITKSIIALGKNFHLKIIAEGVETQEQKEFIIENGCPLIQGYHYSRPLPAEEITKILKSN